MYRFTVESKLKSNWFSFVPYHMACIQLCLIVYGSHGERLETVFDCHYSSVRFVCNKSVYTDR